MLNVAESVVFAFDPRMLGGAPATELNVTLCPTDWNVQLTVVPTETTMLFGEKVSDVVAVTAFVATGVFEPPVLLGAVALYELLPPHAAAEKIRPKTAVRIELFMGHISIRV